MTIFWGEPIEYSDYEEVDTWEECLEDCFEQEDCVLVYTPNTTNCWLFRYGNVTKIQKLDGSSANGKKVAFRSTIPSNTCPVSPDSFSQSYTSQNSLYNSTITSSNVTWQVTYSTKTCPLNSTLFQRQIGPVCVGIRYFEGFECGNWYNASELCGENGGRITGPGDSEELKILLSWTTKSANLAAGCPAAKAPGGIVWLDGNSLNVTKQFIYQDETISDYNKNLRGATVPKGTVPGYCYYLATRQQLVDDYPCAYVGSPTDCFIGAACRLEPI